MTTRQETSTDPMAAYAALVGPGGPYEMEQVEVLGTMLPVYKNRQRALHEVLAGSVVHGDRVYLATADDQVTFADHAARVSSLAHELATTHGVRRGDTVAISGANTIEWIETFWAVVSLGAVAVAFNAWWSDREVEHAVGLTGPVLGIADAKRVDALRRHDVPVLTFDDVTRLRTAHPDAPLPSAEVAEDDPAAVIFTSGTSGRPKGATHSHRNLLAVVEYHRMNDALMAAFGDPTDPRDRSYLLASPLFHIASLHNLAIPRLATGSKVALHTGAFDVERIYALIEQEKVTNWGAVPTMASRMLDAGIADRFDLSSLRAFSLASAPSSQAFKQRLRDGLPFATALVDSYGLTETCTGVSVATAADLAESPGTLGRPTYGVQMEIRDALGKALGPGEEGEVCVRSCYNMVGYWRNEEATEAAIREDRWLHTGDLGELDEQGRLRLSSRRSDLIIRGGENVYPVEVESALAEHPQVVECMVYGVAHDDLGQEVAVVVVHGDEAPTVEELTDWLKQEIAYYKVPAHWTLTTTPLVRNATGKVVRAAVLGQA
ncbi:class I adenylate-forming enzyme family protein [Nocardioides sp. AE5]|uniref:class I adenylate-forming enzyme family protein n=1 Tax=Nocardioides sp. AE5 TaxID=2962573 RepID=UPI002880FA82|nr:class I adenylate-forming enzyme family protein [Nocardioides sp. AE5]MDT0203138.1 class I adenylate-forming enzyme family protein [Nocardioides sp. AE5]